MENETFNLQGPSQSPELEEILLRLALHHRPRFFSLWAKATREQEDFVTLSYGERLLRVLAHLELSNASLSLPPEIQFISYFNPQYPPSLRELSQPPLGLFVQGHWPSFENSRRLAVVGSRKPTPYSLRMTYRWTRHWVERGWWIISGGAYGIDIEAHRASLEAQGSTMVILGSGLRKLYPKAHERTFAEVLKRGCLVSEYGPWTEPMAYHFPERNRLIAALSQVLFLVQAHDKSGSLSTARTALELGREVMVLRPPPVDAAFSGSQQLIDSGARVVSEPNQLERADLPEI